MNNNKVYLKVWENEGERIKLVYNDGDIVFVTKKDFDRAFGTIVSANKDDVIRDFAIS